MSKKRQFRNLSFLALAVILLTPSIYATLVQQMDLQGLCDRAENIFRGKVLSTTQGTIQVGGGELPTITYRIQVAENFKGTDSLANGKNVVEVRMLAALKGRPQTGDVQFHSILPELPRLEVGNEYLLMTSAPSSVGLSAPIGLGQGCFTISQHRGTEMATNAVGNTGLFDGAVSYSELAQQIRSALAQ